MDRLNTELARVRKRWAARDALLETGVLPAGPVADRRQTAYAAELPQLARRVEQYLETAAADLGECHAAMLASAERLRAGDSPGSVPHQKAALDRLASAETQLRGFWKELIETLERISKPVEGSPHGAEGEYGRSQDVLAAGASAQQDGRPWYWDLPPQAREVIEQSTAATLPPQYEPAITRYYQRLSRGRNAATGGTP